MFPVFQQKSSMDGQSQRKITKLASVSSSFGRKEKYYKVVTLQNKEQLSSPRGAIVSKSL